MEEENQQQVKQEQKEPQQVTTKDPNKVEAGKRLAAINHKKREAKKREEQVQLERSSLKRGSRRDLRQWSKPILWNWGCYSCGGDGWSWLLHLLNQEKTSEPRSTK